MINHGKLIKSPIRHLSRQTRSVQKRQPKFELKQPLAENFCKIQIYTKRRIFKNTKSKKKLEADSEK